MKPAWVMYPHLNQEMEHMDWPLDLGVGFPEAFSFSGEEKENAMKILVLLRREKADVWMLGNCENKKPPRVKTHDMTFCT